MLRLGTLVYPGFQLGNLVAATVVEFANRTVGEPVYEFQLVSEAGGAVKSAVGVSVDTARLGDTSCDTLIIAGMTGIPEPSAGLVETVRNASQHCRRLVAGGTAAFILAEAGLLDGRRATTHWAHAREFAARFPNVTVVEDQIFVTDGPLWTSAGAAASTDTALALMEHDLGAEVAHRVAREMLVYHRRPSSQSQVSELLELRPKSDRIHRAISHIRSNLKTPLSVPQLAKAVHLSPRQFSRTFLAETGLSPAKAVERLRVEAARVMLMQSSHPIDVVAREAGFTDRSRMRRAFIRVFGEPPHAIREKLADEPMDLTARAIAP